MGRELKRVPLDFDWPLDKAWKGYLTPYASRDCPSCEGSGLNPKTKVLSNAWYYNQYPTPSDPELLKIFHLNANFGASLTQDECDHLVDEHRLWDLSAEWKKESPDDERPRWVRKKNVDGSDYYPSAALVNAWSRRGIGHDSINHWICVEHRAKRLGFYGSCGTCDGEGQTWPSPEYKKFAEEWERTEPPEGPGYQLWENVSEGSPVSPVFPSKETFINYLIAEGHSPEAAEKFIDSGYAPSMVMITTATGERVIKSGIDSLEED